MHKFTCLFVCLLSTCVILPSILSQSFHPLHNSYIHSNWGILFSFVGRILNGVSKYKHTFAIPLPNCTYTPIRLLNCTVHDKLQDNCIAINNMITNLNENYAAQFSEMNEKVDITLDALGMYSIQTQEDGTEDNSEHGRKKRDTRLGRKKRDTRLSENFCDNVNQSISSGNVVTNVLTSFFGLPSHEDIVTMMRHVCELGDVIRLNSLEIQKSNEYLSSISTTLDQRITNLETGLDQMNTQINQEQASMYSLTTKLANIAQNISAEMAILLQSQEQMYILFGQLNFFETKLNSVLTGIEAWILGAHTLMTGYLPPTMVTVVDLNRLLAYVSETVLKEPQYINRLYMVHRNPSFFYEYKDIVYTRDSKHIFLTVNVPLTASGGLLTTYRVDRLHVAITENVTWSTRIENVPDFFSISNDREFYAEMSSVHYSSCKGDNLKVCPFEESLKRLAVPTCVSSLFQNDAINVKKLCHISFDDRPVSTQTMMLDKNKYWIYSENAGNSVRWHKFCIKNNKGVAETIPSCRNCIVVIPCACSLTAVDFKVPLNLHDCDLHSSNENNTMISLSYPINLAYVGYYRPLKEFQKISSNQTTLQPTDIGGVIFNITRAHWEDVVESDRHFDIDFKKLVKQQKLHSKAYEDKSTRMLQKTFNESNEFSSSLDTLNKKVDTGLLLFLKKPFYVIAHLSLTTILAFASIGMNIATCWVKST